MKYILLALILTASTCTLAADEKRSITTTDGKQYDRVSISAVNPSGIRIIHSGGIATIPFTILPEDMQREFGYDPTKAEAFRAAAKEANAQNAEFAKKQQALEYRFKKWKDELARKKHVAVNSPSQLLHDGVQGSELEAFRRRVDNIVKSYEARYNTLRKGISVLDANGVDVEMTQRIIDAVYDGEVFIGMPAAFVRLSWGQPTQINDTIWAGSKSEQWVYRRGDYGSQYVYVNDGVVTTIQD